MKNLQKTDINRFIEAQEIPYFCGYKQALTGLPQLGRILELKNIQKPRQ